MHYELIDCIKYNFNSLMSMKTKTFYKKYLQETIFHKRPPHPTLIIVYPDFEIKIALGYSKDRTGHLLF